MSLGAIASGVFAIAKAIPKVMDFFEMVEDLVIQWRLSRITNTYTERQEKIRALSFAISKASTKEERRALAKLLAEYTSGNYRNELPK